MSDPYDDWNDRLYRLRSQRPEEHYGQSEIALALFAGFLLGISVVGFACAFFLVR